MYEEFYGFDKKPFSLQTDPSLLYMGKAHTAAYTMLEYGIVNQAGFTVVTGEIGSGKTTLLNRLLAELDPTKSIGLINNTHKNMGPLLPWVLYAFGLDYTETNAIKRYDIFSKFLRAQNEKGKRTVLIIDEAQNLSLDVMEELRALSNINQDDELLLQIIMLGQPELKDILRRPELRQLCQRIAVDYHLPPLDDLETFRYITSRMSMVGRKEPIFTLSALELIYRASGGVPRLINLVCDTLLSYGFADQVEKIDLEFVRGVLKEWSDGGGLALTSDPQGLGVKENIVALKT